MISDTMKAQIEKEVHAIVSKIQHERPELKSGFLYIFDHSEEYEITKWNNPEEKAYVRECIIKLLGIGEG